MLWRWATAGPRSHCPLGPWEDDAPDRRFESHLPPCPMYPGEGLKDRFSQGVPCSLPNTPGSEWGPMGASTLKTVREFPPCPEDCGHFLSAYFPLMLLSFSWDPLPPSLSSSMRPSRKGRFFLSFKAEPLPGSLGPSHPLSQAMSQAHRVGSFSHGPSVRGTPLCQDVLVLTAKVPHPPNSCSPGQTGTEGHTKSTASLLCKRHSAKSSAPWPPAAPFGLIELKGSLSWCPELQDKAPGNS